MKKIFSFCLGFVLAIVIIDLYPFSFQSVVLSPLSDTYAHYLSPLGSIDSMVLGQSDQAVITYQDLLDQEKESRLAISSNTGQVKTQPVLTSSQSAEFELSAAKQKLSILFYGDSMLQSLSDCQYLSKLLFDKIDLSCQNLSLGAENIKDAYLRAQKPYTYQDQTYPAATTLKADLIILGTYSYNPMALGPAEALLVQKEYLAKLYDLFSPNAPHLYFLLENAPNQTVFAKYDDNLFQDLAWRHQQLDSIFSYLNNASKYFIESNLPAINAYHPSLGSDKQGNLEYISSTDGIHPSQTGQKYIYALIAKSIKHDILTKYD